MSELQRIFYLLGNCVESFLESLALQPLPHYAVDMGTALPRTDAYLFLFIDQRLPASSVPGLGGPLGMTEPCCCTVELLN